MTEHLKLYFQQNHPCGDCGAIYCGDCPFKPLKDDWEARQAIKRCMGCSVKWEDCDPEKCVKK